MSDSVNKDPAPPEPGQATQSANSQPVAGQPPTIGQQIAESSNLLKGVGLLLAALPPLAVITGLVDIPPTLEQIVKMVTLPISIVTVLGIYVIGDTIARMSPRRAFLIFGLSALLGASLTVGYFVIAHPRIVSVGEERIVIPISPSEKIVEIVEPYDFNYQEALRNSPDKDELRNQLRQQQGPTVALMIALMVLAQILLVAGMVGLLAKAVLGQSGPGSGRAS